MLGFFMCGEGCLLKRNVYIYIYTHVRQSSVLQIVEVKLLVCLSVVPGAGCDDRATMGRKEITCSWKKVINNIRDVFEFKQALGS